jgi:hypothetical protein
VLFMMVDGGWWMQEMRGCRESVVGTRTEFESSYRYRYEVLIFSRSCLKLMCTDCVVILMTDLHPKWGSFEGRREWRSYWKRLRLLERNVLREKSYSSAWKLADLLAPTSRSDEC